MSLFGKLIRVVNAPATALERLIAGEKVKDEDRLMSAPLEALAKAIDEATDDDD